MPAQERAEAEGQYHHMGRLARYHNIMGKETIEMLDRDSIQLSFNRLRQQTIFYRGFLVSNTTLQNLLIDQLKFN